MRTFVAALLAAVVAVSGCSAPDAEGAQEPGVAGSDDPAPWVVTYLGRETLQLTGLQPETFRVEVPADAGEILVAVTPQGGAYDGRVSISGLGDCDDTTNSGGTVVDLGTGNGAGYGRCSLEPGTYDVTVSVDSGRVAVDVDVLAAVPRAS